MADSSYTPILLFIIVGLFIFGTIYVNIFQFFKERRGLQILLEKIKSGKIHNQFTAGNLPVELSPGEKPTMILPHIALLEPRAVRITRSTWDGPSFRLARGLYFRTGSSYSTGESHEELRLVDNGTLAVTNKRLVFVGKLRTVNVKLNKIVGLDVYRNAIGLHAEGKEKTRYFQPKFTATIDFKDGDTTYNVPFKPPLLKAYIEAELNSMLAAR